MWPSNGEVGMLAKIIGRQAARYAPGCTGKKRYDTQHAAARAVQHIGLKLGIYRCRHCGGWHLTSRKRA